MKKDKVKISDLIPDDKNFNTGTQFGNSLIEKSFQKFGAGRSILLDKNNRIIAGNKSVENASAIGMEDVQIVESDGKRIIAVKRTDIDLDSPEGREMALADNATAKANIIFDAELVEAELGEAVCEEWGVGLGTDTTQSEDESRQKLTEKFIVPPFSVLDTRQGYWQERKRHWRVLSADKGETRIGALYKGGGKEGGVTNKLFAFNANNGVSLLDPVLAELVNTWFGLPGGSTFDCFAGDSVFGYVSAYLGNTFTGIELRKEQADLNNSRIAGLKAKYICDDGRNVLNHIKPDSQDLLFSCPPYFDLEVYSDLPEDASNQKEYSEFLKILDEAFTAAIKCLKENRFAVITVGDVRDKKGFYYRFVDDIKDIFKKSGALLYNECILVEPIGTSAMKVGAAMITRKIVKTHQNVLVFCKGDWKKASDAVGNADA